MSAVDLDAVMNGLKPFQQDAVHHVSNLFYGSESAEHPGKFLIADETGLGKSVVARGVVAHTIRTLEQDDSVDRIDVVYICSNADLAQQNLKRLNVTGQQEIAMATRLSMLARESSKLNKKRSQSGAKPVNLISFTPGTSFSAFSRRDGHADERALITLLLDELLEQTPQQQRATRVMFQQGVRNLERFSHLVTRLSRELTDGVDPEIYNRFWNLIDSTRELQQFIAVRDRIGGLSLPQEEKESTLQVLGFFRKQLSHASVETLEPDLVILDEFQRFKNLLDPENDSDASQLANEIFEYPGVKVLLLSATPYKPFTQAGDDEDHYKDFLATIGFLTGNDHTRVREVRDAFSRYRRALQVGKDADKAALHVRELLIPMMSRSERPSVLEEDDLVRVQELTVPVPTDQDLSDWVSLSKLGDVTGSPVSVEYWKSIPYFANFMDGYRIGEKVKDLVQSSQCGVVTKTLKHTRGLSPESVEKKASVDPGNGQLRALMSETVDKGWWQLLWMPPSMPYLEPGPIYREFHESGVTKHVIFSAWSATPTAIASILSHEAERKMLGISVKGRAERAPEHVSQRFQYRQADEAGASLSTLALFWPHPGLLKQADQLAEARKAGSLVTPQELLSSIEKTLGSAAPTDQAWEAFFSHEGAFDPNFTDEGFVTQVGREHEGHTGLLANMSVAKAFAQEHRDRPLSHTNLAAIVAFAPGSIAYRAVAALAGPNCTKRGIWRAAYSIAEAFRGLFNRPDSQGLIDVLYRDDAAPAPYWRRVLKYCADGNLRAVLDEYLFQLWCETGQREVTDAMLLSFATTLSEAIGLRPARYVAHDTTPERSQIPMMARFAVRYGGKESSGSETRSNLDRQKVVRAAFNSPFAPFVLASTSVGQEGIDFHWWSHSVVHWNLPSNPVDFEQREGRVNRYGGLAVRKNVAEAHWSDVLTSTDPSAWRAAFEAASEVESEAGEFSPWWVYPGSTRIQRVLLQYPLSRDIEKYDRLRSALTLYRLTLGQPRQEDMVEMLQKRNIDASKLPTIDLRPPSSCV